MITRRLAPGDEVEVDAFLARHAASSMFLRAGLYRSGLEPGEGRTHGVWIGAWMEGELVGVLSHFRLGNVVLQAPRALPALLERLAEHRRQPIHGFVGPRTQVVAAHTHPRSPTTEPKLDNVEILLDLELRDLVVPPALEVGEVRCVVPSEADLELLTRWGVAYSRETMGIEAGQRAVRAWRKRGRDGIREQRIFMLLRDGEPVSMSGFNAALPDCVQIGGVFTPPALRRRGFARCSVAGSLVFVRQRGVTRSVLFTEPGNPARRAYEAIGFREVGRYGILLYELP